MLCRNFLKIAIVNHRSLPEINNILGNLMMVPVDEADLTEVAAELPKRVQTQFLTMDLFRTSISAPPMKTYKNLSWEEVSLLMGVSKKMSEVIQLGLLLKVENFAEILQRQYVGQFDPYILDLYKKYLFDVDSVTAIDFFNYIQRGKELGIVGHLTKALSNRSFATFLLTGQGVDDLNMLVKNAGQVAYAKFMECFQTNDPLQAQRWAGILIKAAQVKTPSQKNDLMDQLEQLSIEWDEKTNVYSEVDKLPDDAVVPDPVDDVLPD